MTQPSKKSSDPDKLDLILNQLKALGPMQEKLDTMLSAISTVREEVKSLQFDVANNSDRITALEKEMISVRVNDNAQQQHLRSLTLRLLNLPYSPGEADDNNSGLCNTVYDRVLKPVWPLLNPTRTSLPCRSCLMLLKLASEPVLLPSPLPFSLLTTHLSSSNLLPGRSRPPS